METNFYRRKLNIVKKFKYWLSPGFVLVLTMGKVGTLTIVHSCYKSGIFAIHPHSWKWTWPGIYFLKIEHNFLERIYYIYRSFKKRLAFRIWSAIRPKIKIITGIRDPFSRYISAYFEQCHYLPYNIDEMAPADIENDIRKLCTLTDTMDWFENEITSLTGIPLKDAYSLRENGCIVLKKNKYEVLVYKLKSLSNLNQEIKNFVGANNFQLESINLTQEENDHSLIFKQIYNEFRFTNADWEMFQEHEYSKLFSNKELIDMKERWVST